MRKPGAIAHCDERLRPITYTGAHCDTLRWSTARRISLRVHQQVATRLAWCEVVLVLRRGNTGLSEEYVAQLQRDLIFVQGRHGASGGWNPEGALDRDHEVLPAIGLGAKRVA